MSLNYCNTDGNLHVTVGREWLSKITHSRFSQGKFASGKFYYIVIYSVYVCVGGGVSRGSVGLSLCQCLYSFFSFSLETDREFAIQYKLIHENETISLE